MFYVTPGLDALSATPELGASDDVLDTSSVTPGLVTSDAVLIYLDDSALIDGDVTSAASSSSIASSIEASMLIDLNASFEKLTRFISEYGVLISLFSSFDCYS